MNVVITRCWKTLLSRLLTHSPKTAPQMTTGKLQGEDRRSVLERSVPGVAYRQLGRVENESAQVPTKAAVSSILWRC